jgi:hypothetical protein
VHPAAGPYAYVISSQQIDPHETVLLAKTLFDAGVEVQQATSAFEAGGKSYPAGSYIVALDQPYRAFAKTVLERQKYPDIREYPGGPPQRPYDVTGTTLPLFYGVTADAVDNQFTASAKKLDAIAPVVGHVEGGAAKGYLLDDTSNASLYATFSLLSEGVKLYRLTGGSAPGTIYIPAQPGLEAKLQTAAKRFAVDFKPAATPPAGGALALKAPRVGLYKSYQASLDEGWTRFILDSNGVPYTSIVNSDIKKGNLIGQFDAIILPDNSAGAILGNRGGGEGRGGGGYGGARLNMPQVPEQYRGGLGADGAAALKAFVDAGGTIITNNKAADVYATKENATFTDALEGVPSKEFYCPGSILEIAVDTTNPIAFGSTPTVPIFFETGPTFKVSGDAKSVAHYANDHPLLSGWILGGKYLDGTSAIAEVPEGKGRIIAFGFIPMYRGLSEVTYKFLLNAMLYSGSAPSTLGAGSAH